MKLNSLIALAMGAVVAAPAVAQNADDCAQKLMFLNQAYKRDKKTRNYTESSQLWEDAYKSCPTYSENIYIMAPSILGWQLNQAKTPDERTKVLDRMMKCYDERMANFSKKPKYEVRARKACDYINYAKYTTYNSTDPNNKVAYDWLKQSLKEGGADNTTYTFQQYYVTAAANYAANKNANRQAFVDDYLMLTDLLSQKVEADQTDSVSDQLKSAIEFAFSESGAADCKTLDGIYASQLASHQTDADYLNNVVKLYDMAGCDEAKVYFQASEYLYKLKPTYNAASGLAAQAYSKGDLTSAINYLNKASELTTSRADKSNIKLKIAGLYAKRKDYGNARRYAREAIAANSHNGKAYIFIGNLYAASSSSISSDALVQRTAFWAACDKFEKAKQVDPMCAATADRMINTYKKYFPSKKDYFMAWKLKAGQSYHVPGWIDENTTVR